MIEKIVPKIERNDFMGTLQLLALDCVDKINEIVDAVNTQKN